MQAARPATASVHRLGLAEFFLEKRLCFCSEAHEKNEPHSFFGQIHRNQGINIMSKITLTGFALLLLLFLGNSTGNYAAQPKQKNSDPPTGTFQRMIAENGECHDGS